jgi:hypothetical protein
MFKKLAIGVIGITAGFALSAGILGGISIANAQVDRCETMMDTSHLKNLSANEMSVCEVSSHHVWLIEKDQCIAEVWMLPATYQTVGDHTLLVENHDAVADSVHVSPVADCEGKPISDRSYSRLSNHRLLDGTYLNGKPVIA